VDTREEILSHVFACHGIRMLVLARASYAQWICGLRLRKRDRLSSSGPASFFTALSLAFSSINRSMVACCESNFASMRATSSSNCGSVACADLRASTHSCAARRNSRAPVRDSAIPDPIRAIDPQCEDVQRVVVRRSDGSIPASLFSGVPRGGRLLPF